MEGYPHWDAVVKLAILEMRDGDSYYHSEHVACVRFVYTVTPHEQSKQ